MDILTFNGDEGVSAKKRAICASIVQLKIPECAGNISEERLTQAWGFSIALSSHAAAPQKA